MRRVILFIMVLLAATAVFGQLQLDPVWSLAPGDRAYIQNDNNQRGMAYNPVSGNVLVVSRSGGTSVNVLDGATGADLGAMDLTGVSGGTFLLNQVGVADDGVVYAGNLTLDGSGISVYKLYRWQDEASVPLVAFTGDPGNGAADRWGDTMDVTGTGSSTQVLLGSNSFGGSPGVNAALFTSVNGVFFDPTTVTTAAAGGDFRLGVTFGAADSFWGKSTGTPLAEYSLVDGSIINSTMNIPASITAVDYDPVRNWMLGLHYQDSAKVMLFDMADPDNPVQLAEAALPTDNPNLNGTGAVKFGEGNRVYVLGTNNGVAAFDIVPEPATLALGFSGLGLLILRRRRR